MDAPVILCKDGKTYDKSSIINQMQHNNVVQHQNQLNQQNQKVKKNIKMHQK